MPDFTAILSARVEDVPEPKAIPAGTYYGIIPSLPELREGTSKSRPGEKYIVVDVPVRLTEAGPDVDPDALSLAGGLERRNGQPLEFKQGYFWRDEDNNFDYGLRVLAEGLGHVNGSWEDILPELVGGAVTCTIGHMTSNRTGLPVAVLNSIAARVD